MHLGVYLVESIAGLVSYNGNDCCGEFGLTVVKAPLWFALLQSKFESLLILVQVCAG